ncbi:CvpA family protein [Streptococcus pluranimalium]|uniref:CvpA family protein n=1 Tax=Streptococcus pluranimalium TaxID=82348 RepID=UPI0039FDCAF3
MITLLLLISLAWSFYIGFSRGILRQGFYSLGSLLALALAQNYYKPLAKLLYIWIPYANPTEGSQIFFFRDVDLFSHDMIFYAGVAFLSLYSLFYAMIRLLGILLHLLPLNRYNATKHHLIAGCLSCLVLCLTLSMVATILATIPFDTIQQTLAGNPLTRFLIESFPFFSNYLKHLWVTQMLP